MCRFVRLLWLFFFLRVFRLLCFYTTNFFLISTTSIFSNTMIPLSSPFYRFVRLLRPFFFKSAPPPLLLYYHFLPNFYNTMIPLSFPLYRFVRVLKLLRVLRLLRSVNRNPTVSAGGDVFRSVFFRNVLLKISIAHLLFHFFFCFLPFLQTSEHNGADGLMSHLLFRWSLSSR